MKLLTVAMVRNSTIHRVTDMEAADILRDFCGYHNGVEWIPPEEIVTVIQDDTIYHYLRSNILSITERRVDE